MGQTREDNNLFDSVGERINKVLSRNFSDGTVNVDIYDALYGNDKKQDSSKKNKISELRHGRNVQLNDLILISKRFGVSLDWLVWGEVPPTRKDEPFTQEMESIFCAIQKLETIGSIAFSTKRFPSKFWNDSPREITIKISPNLRKNATKNEIMRNICLARCIEYYETARNLSDFNEEKDNYIQKARIQALKAVEQFDEKPDTSNRIYKNLQLLLATSRKHSIPQEFYVLCTTSNTST